jgi:hypothetical protein
VADDLGSAVLRLTLDDSALRSGLQQTENVVRQTTQRLQGAIATGGGPDIRAQLALARQLTQAAREYRAVQQGPITGGGPDVAQQRLQIEQRIAAVRDLSAESALRAERLLTEAAKRREQIVRRSRGFAGRAGGAISSGIIGGGFPLLFGQGVGAAVGGGIGGIAGGAIGGGFGFGLSVIGTAVGAAFDETLTKAKTLAAGLNDPIGQFDALRAASILSSRGLERQVQALIDSGREAEAAAQIQLDLTRSYGDTAALNELRNEFDELGRAFTQLGILTAKFVAGPLADFLNKLGASFNAFSNRALFEERLANAPREVQEEARRVVRGRAGELQGTSTLSDVAAQSYQAGLDFLDETIGKTKEVRDAEAAVAAASQRQQELDAARVDLIAAQGKGYDRQALILRKNIASLEEAQKIAAAPPEQQDAIRREFLLKQLTFAAQLAALDRERLATLQLQSAEFRIGAQTLQRQIVNATALAKVQTPQGISIERQELERRQQIQEAIAAAREKELRLGARIDAARIRGGDTGEQEAARLVNDQRLAAQETRLALIEGATALRDAGQRLVLDLTNAAIRLTEVRSDPQGLNRFLDPGRIQARAQQDFALLLPQFREAQGRFRSLTGANAPEFTGPTAGVNAAIRDFINAVDREFGATETLEQTQRALADNTSELAAVNRDLAAATNELASKEWNVQVQVNSASGAASASGDVLQGALS